jgi:diazepam-binding inhibitor (GABA receptor modulator, acyl-CoA-binding protein)
MNDLDREFEQAVAASRLLSERPDNFTLLRLYALFKQATTGDASGERPGMADLVGRAKWDAWSALKGMPATEAKQAYIALVDDLRG